jgi:hypothetical protein
VMKLRPFSPGSLALALLLVAGATGVAEAHPSGLRAGDPWWRAWNADWLVLSNLAIMAGMYAYGLRRMWRRAGAGRGVRTWRALAFAGCAAGDSGALLSPIDALSDDLSWVHMLQHLILMAVAAPLLVIGYPELVLLWVMPTAGASRAGGWPQRNAIVGACGAPRGTRCGSGPFMPWCSGPGTCPCCTSGRCRSAGPRHRASDVFPGGRSLLEGGHRPAQQPASESGAGRAVPVHDLAARFRAGRADDPVPASWYPIYVGRTEVWNLTPWRISNWQA